MYHRTVAALVLVLAFTACAESPTANDPNLTPAFAAWEDKVNGSADLYVGTCAILISASLSATEWADGTASGQLQIKAVDGTGTVPNCVPIEPEVLRYQFHGTVNGMVVGSTSTARHANICGTISAEQGEGYGEVKRPFAVGDAFALNVTKRNDGVDFLRVLTGTTNTNPIDCDVLNTSMGARAYAGGFRIR